MLKGKERYTSVLGKNIKEIKELLMEDCVDP